VLNRTLLREKREVRAIEHALRWSLLVLVVLTLGYLGVGLLVAARLTTPVRQQTEQTPADEGLDFQEVDFQSTDGLDLKGWWVSGDDPSRAVVLVHGLDGSKSSQHVLKTASVYSEAGYGVLMLDLRGHGESEGERTTLGYQEVRDVRGALSWLEERGFQSGEVVLHGWSMGGATVLRSAPKAGVAAVVEESGYADLPLLLRDRLPESSGLPSFFNPSIFLMAKLFLDFDPWAVRPDEDAATLSEESVPLLIIHSADDEVVPIEQAELLLASYPGAEFWKIEGYDHVQAYTHPEYRQKLLNFLDHTHC
jgi:dipeptidyl aminopeptidase/acylaminoacyl peptidase